MTTEPPNSHATLLFVDDESSILNSLRRLFRPLGYKIFTAESGAAGLELIERERVDLVIFDMRMMAPSSYPKFGNAGPMSSGSS